MRFYNIQKHWSKIKPHLSDPSVLDTMVKDFNKYTYGRWRQQFTSDKVPGDFESCDWQYGRIGRKPAYWRYVKHAACHWLVNFNLELAQRVLPKEEWRIVGTQKHSTTWNGKDTLFDFNGQALFDDADDAWNSANGEDGFIQEIGEHLPLSYSDHYSEGWSRDASDAMIDKADPPALVGILMKQNNELVKNNDMESKW